LTHQIAKIKQAFSFITTLRNGDVTLNEQDEISKHIVNHFTNLFTKNSNIANEGMVEEVIPNLVTERINTMLTLL